MRKLIAKLIHWALGGKPLIARQWHCFIEGYDESSIYLDESEFSKLPPSMLRVPRVEAKEIKKCDPPEEVVVDRLYAAHWDFERMVVFYKRVKPQPTGDEK